MSQYSLSLLVLDKRLELGTARDGQVKRLGREERLEVEQIEVVLVDEIGDELVGEAIECRHLRQRQTPASVRRAVDVSDNKQKEEYMITLLLVVCGRRRGVVYQD